MELSRRQWLLGSLSAVFAGAGCSPTPRHIAGGFAGPDVRTGHLLRDRAFLAGPPDGRQEVAVAIVGGGVAGLSAAWALSRAGMDDFVVLELEDQPGGTSRCGQGPVTPYPWGAHYVPVPSRSAVAATVLLSELSVITGFDAAGRAVCAEQYLCREPQERIFYKGRWYDGLYLRAGASAEDLRQLERFQGEVGRWVRARSAAGRRPFTLPQARGDRLAGGAGELDGLSMATYLSRLGLSSWRLRWLVDYGCRDDFGLRADSTSAWAGMHYHAARLDHPDDHPPEVLTWPEGNGWLVQRLAERIGPGRLRTGCAAFDVRPLDSGRTEVLHLTPEGRRISLSARHVIFALPTFLRRHLIAPLRAAQKEAAYLDRFTHSPWLVANLTLRRPAEPPVALGSSLGRRNVARVAPGYPLCWDNVLYDSPSLGYVVATHQREPLLLPDGVPRTVFTYYLPLCGPDPRAERRQLLDTSFATCCQFILADLQRAEPDLSRDVERIDIFRWGHAMVRPVAGLFTSDALAQAALPLSGIHFAHTDLAGMALFEEAQHAGVAAAEAVMAARGHRFETLS